MPLPARRPPVATPRRPVPLPRQRLRRAHLASGLFLAAVFGVLAGPRLGLADPGQDPGPSGSCGVSGVLRLQGRPTHGGIGLRVDGAAAGSSDASGAFDLPSLEPGSRRLTARMAGFLPLAVTVDCRSGEALRLPGAELPGGDAGGDGKVDLFDLVRVGRAYGLCDGQEGFDGAADLGANGCVDLFDLVLVGRNYGRGGEQPWPTGGSRFQAEVLPLMQSRCVSCHGNRGGLNLAGHAAIMAGGQSGAAVIPGDPAGSLLVRKMRGRAGLLMPPAAALPEAEIALVEAWIREGARP